jgi:hypothetical protein
MLAIAHSSLIFHSKYWFHLQEKSNAPTKIGAVTTGKLWEFARLDRNTKHIEQGFDSYRVPEDLDPLMRILVQSLSQEIAP